MADDRERITTDDLGKADERRAGVVVVVLHDPHRPGPQHLDSTIEQRPLGQSGTRRRQKLYCQTFGGVGADYVRGIERRLKHKAVILVKP